MAKHESFCHDSLRLSLQFNFTFMQTELSSLADSIKALTFLR